MADKTPKTQTEKTMEELEDLLLEIKRTGENLRNAYEWGSGTGLARHEAQEAIDEALKFIKARFTIKEQ